MTDSSAALRARLNHDVGKYIARAASNIASGPVPAALHAMLIDDLYGSQERRRASERLRALSARAPDGVLGMLDEIAALETAVRRGDAEAIQSAASLARQIRDALRAWATESPP
jgi:hypothetical protein